MRATLLLCLVLASACAPSGRLFQRGPRPDANVEGQFTRALVLLEPGANLAALDSATMLLDAYLANAGYVTRRPEATVLRRLATDAIQLSKVATALQQERADTRAKSAEPEQPAQRTDTDSLKEIQRLKDQLAEANAELERIKKRLATQKP